MTNRLKIYAKILFITLDQFLMSNIPEKCSRCGAPIDWDDGAAFTKCEFVGLKII